MNGIMTDKEVYERYGQPNNWKDYVKFYPPFQMYLAWNLTQKINFFYCHKFIHPMLTQAFDHLLECYSDEGIHDLGIDLYGGCFNYRLMRGSTTRLSRHSWGIAIDMHPSMNKLSWGSDKAVFAEDDYKDMMNAFYEAGFINYGVEKDRDYMHFEPKRI